MEISPETEAPIKSILYYSDSSWMQCEQLELLGNNMFVEKPEKPASYEHPRKYSLTFDGLEANQNYKLIFSTEINGRTIMQTIRDFECLEV